jgi:hypothetical protein
MSSNGQILAQAGGHRVPFKSIKKRSGALAMSVFRAQ